jgi:predicted transcriptional regulator
MPQYLTPQIEQMSSDDPADDREDDPQQDDSGPLEDDLDRTRERLEEGAGRAVDQFDQGIVDLLAWLLDTETRARIYVYLRQHPGATSQEIADGTGLYPSTVREALSDLHEEGTVSRKKRESEGAGNNPYAYRAIPPSELVSDAVGEIQSELNAVFTLDDRLRGRANTESEPVTISVEGFGDDSGRTQIDIEDAEESDDETADSETPRVDEEASDEATAVDEDGSGSDSADENATDRDA